MINYNFLFSFTRVCARVPVCMRVCACMRACEHMHVCVCPSCVCVYMEFIYMHVCMLFVFVTTDVKPTSDNEFRSTCLAVSR